MTLRDERRGDRGSNTDAGGRAVTEVDRRPRRRDGDLQRRHRRGRPAGAANSAKLLLRSANDKHPHGLANGSDQVGRNYMFHNSMAVAGDLARSRTRPMFQKTLASTISTSGAPDFEFPMGNIQMVGKSQAPMFKGEKPLETKLAPMFSLDEVAKHAVDFWLTTEDLPTPENRVTVDGDGEIQLAYTPEQPGAQEAALPRSCKSMLEPPRACTRAPHPANNLYMKNDIPIAGVAHQAGTCRFGTDPATSVLDVNCKAHELDNLYVVDTSFFPSIGAVNPALTAMANALRVGEHLLERLGVAAAVERTRSTADIGRLASRTRSSPSTAPGSSRAWRWSRFRPRARSSQPASTTACRARHTARCSCPRRSRRSRRALLGAGLARGSAPSASSSSGCRRLAGDGAARPEPVRDRPGRSPT